MNQPDTTSADRIVRQTIGGILARIDSGSDTIRDRVEFPAGNGTDRWTVTGEAGRVEFDEHGGHLKLIDAYGDTEAVLGRDLERVAEYARLNEDDLVFALLAHLYRTELAGGALVDAMAPAGRWGCEK